MDTAKLALVTGLVAIVIAASAVLGFHVKLGGDKGLLGSTSCASITCLSGGLRLVTDAGGDFEADVASVFAGTVSLTNTFKLGTNGTALSRINSGFCNIQAGATTIAASSTKTVDCQASTNGTQAPLIGVTAGDKCFLSQGSTTPTTFAGLSFLGASASSTQGYITTVISNDTGATFTWTAAASSSWPYYCVS